jgi:hypothetical protein
LVMPAKAGIQIRCQLNPRTALDSGLRRNDATRASRRL